MLVPALVYLLHMDQHLAQGTSLFILLPPVGLGALREYWKQGQVDLRAGILCALGMLVGGYFGGLIAVPLASRHLKGLFGCFLILAAFLLWRKPQPENRTMASAGEGPPVGDGPIRDAGIFGAACLCGIASGTVRYRRRHSPGAVLGAVFRFWATSRAGHQLDCADPADGRAGVLRVCQGGLRFVAYWAAFDPGRICWRHVRRLAG